jgi:hypothetical protein
MQDLFDNFSFNQLQMTTLRCMVDHIHLDNKYIQRTLPKRNNMRYGSLLIILFDSDCVHIYLNKLF